MIKKIACKFTIFLIMIMMMQPAFASSSTEFANAIEAAKYLRIYCPDDYSLKAQILIKKAMPYSYPLCEDNTKLKQSAKWQQLSHGFNQALQKAIKGKSLAQYQVAMSYLFGIGVNVNASKASYWIKKSSSQNFKAAIIQHALFLMSGPERIGKSYSQLRSMDLKAYSILLELAKKGNNLAFAIVFPLYYTKHPKQAFIWAKKQAKSGNVFAYEILGGLYMMKTKNMNITLAQYWTKKAIHSKKLSPRSYAAALYNLGVLSFLNKKPKAGKKLIYQSSLLNYKLAKQIN